MDAKKKAQRILEGDDPESVLEQARPSQDVAEDVKQRILEVFEKNNWKPDSVEGTPLNRIDIEGENPDGNRFRFRGDFSMGPQSSPSLNMRLMVRKPRGGDNERRKETHEFTPDNVESTLQLLIDRVWTP